MAEDRRSNNEEFSFIKEKIKKQPFYQTRRFRQLCYWLLVAALCGAVACFVFVKLQPFMERARGSQLCVRKGTALYGANLRTG